MNIEKTIEIIQKYAKSLTEMLMEIRYQHIDKIQTTMTVQIRMALIECLDLQITDLDRAINEVKIKIADCHNKVGMYGLQQRLQAELISLKQLRHERVMANNSIKKSELHRKDKAALMITRTVIFEQFGKEKLEEIKAIVEDRLNEQINGK
ncbi:MAG: hypothetical protein MUF12_00555 [Sediminibacterium sp.]|jgi:hypothetical protein|nr:hypothetical protein [Sediminibacterium sp.]